MACIDLVEVLLVDYSQRLLETFSTKAFLQLILFLLCHPNWEIRKAAYGTSRKILGASHLLAEAILLEFLNYLSVVGEKTIILKMSDAENVTDSQVHFLPSVEVLVKALVVIAPVVSARGPYACVQLLLCLHHPCIIGTGKKNAVWRVSFSS
ncbi:protein ILITYHIA-like [Salvia miltiorrhiza]|uniref:protein ILITYHIA-like n=1 Tax=Salvia miltiorrhiza TaxID=226208 RepID=UPI0025AD5432|nr:protein ILITYHIA-like [Salvia miltiorrhiza]